MIVFIHYTLLLIAIILFYYGYIQFIATKQILKNGIKTKATVIDLLTAQSENHYVYKPLFEYTDKSGNVHTFESEIESYPAPYKIGEKVAIIYAKKDKKIKIISYWGLYRWSIILFSIASQLIVIGGGYLLYSISLF